MDPNEDSSLFVITNATSWARIVTQKPLAEANPFISQDPRILQLRIRILADGILL
jgi:hypothetical protein